MISKMLMNKNQGKDNSNSFSLLPVSNLKMACRNSGKFNTIIWILAMTTVLAYFGTNIVKQTEAYPVNLMMPRKYPVNVEVENPEELISTLDNLIQNILVGIDSSHSNNLINVKSPGTNKRGIDLGLSRGFSGSQAAKHLMGMSAASFANGPGRKR